MEGEAFVHVGDEHHGGALDLALLGNLAVVGHHLGDDPGAFCRVFHVDVVLVFHEDIVAVGHPVGVAVLETGDAGGNLLALAVFHPGRVVGIGDQGFLVRQGGFGVADCIELSLELRGVVKSASCFEMFRVHFRISLVETMFLLLNDSTMCHRAPRIGAHGAHGGQKAKIKNKKCPNGHLFYFFCFGASRQPMPWKGLEGFSALSASSKILPISAKIAGSTLELMRLASRVFLMTLAHGFSP